MAKVKSLADLRQIKSSLEEKMRLRENAEDYDNLVQVKVAMATCGIAAGAKIVMEYLIEEFDKRGIDAVVTQTGCMGYCYAEPTIEVTLPKKDPVVFGYVDKKRVDEIISKYINEGELVDGIIPVNYQTIKK